MDTLIAISLRHRGLVVVLAFALLVWGGFITQQMPVDVLPDLTAPSVVILTETRGMAPVEVERLVTLPIETSINGVSGLRRVRSSSWVGISIVWADFNWGTDLREARQRITERLTTVMDRLPAEVERPILTPESSVMGEIAFIGLTSKTWAPDRLRETAELQVRRRLLAVQGISQVSLLGGAERQYQVRLNPSRMALAGVTLEQVLDALRRANHNLSAGILNERASEWLVVGEGRLTSLEDIAKTIVTHREGVPVLIENLGDVGFGHAQRRGEGSLNAQPAVLFGIQKEPGANTLKLTEQLDRLLDQIESELSDEVTLHKQVFRQADFIEVAVSNVRRALLEGIGLVVLVVLVFLANPRATLISVLAIPLSLVVAILVLHFSGATINTMTLGGMAIAIGALVDDAVIDVENVVRRLRLAHAESVRSKETASAASGSLDMSIMNPLIPPRPSIRVVYEASVEIRQSIVFATLIIALVFIPIFFLSGVEGRLLQPLGVAYLVALGASLLVAVTVTPALCLFLLPGSSGILRPQETRFILWLKTSYERPLKGALAHPWYWTLPVVLAGVVALGSLLFAGRSFLPEFNEGALTLHAVTLPGTALPESSELGQVVERELMKFPEVQVVARRTGRAERDEHVLGVESSEIDVTLQLGDRNKDELLAALRASLESVPGVNVTIGQPISHRIDHLLSGTRASIAIKLFGNDLHRLRSLGAQVESVVSTIPGVVDLNVEPQTDVPMLRVVYDREAMARHGLTVDVVAAALESAVQGVGVTQLFEDALVLDLVVKTTTGESVNIDALPDLLLDSPMGHRVPLNDVARIVKDVGPNQIGREQLQRKLVVSCNTAGRDLGSVVRDIQRVVDPLLLRAPGYRVEYGGQFESAAQANRILLGVSALVIVGIACLLNMAFGSLRDTFLILLNLPLALIGGILGVWISGGILSVASIIGFITVFGIATRNGILLVSHIRHLQKFEGVRDLAEAVRRGAVERLVPILMTALASGLALVPIALSGDRPGNEIQTPMAIVILFGLMSSMTLNIFLVPALYLRFGKPTAAVGSTESSGPPTSFLS